MRPLRVVLNLTVKDDADDEVVGEKLFDMVASDPLDLIPEISTVDGFDFPRGDR